MISLYLSLAAAIAFAQSGIGTGTFVNPSVPNGVESNPTTFENTQPVLGATPAATAVPKLAAKKKLPPGNYKMEKQSFASPPDTMEKGTPEPKEKSKKP